MTMHRNVRDRWCAALRSGRYDAGRGCLRSAEPDGTSRYDPLGVLCDLSGHGEWEKLYPDADRWSFRYDEEQYYRCFPPLTLLMAVRLPLGCAVAVATMSDEGRSFADVAAWIENNI